MSGRTKPNDKPKPKSQKPRPGQWDLLNNTLGVLVEYAKLPTDVSKILRSPEVMAKVTDRPLLVDRATLLCKDCTVLTKELLSLKREHEGKKGNPKNPDDNMLCVDIHSRYIEWAERYEAVVYPTYLAINEQVGSDLGVEIMAVKPSDAVLASDQNQGTSNDNQ